MHYCYYSPVNCYHTRYFDKCFVIKLDKDSCQFLKDYDAVMIPFVPKGAKLDVVNNNALFSA